MVKHQARMDIVVGLRELKRHAGLLHNDRMRKPGLCYHSPFKMVYTDSPCTMLVPSFGNFRGENPSPVRKSILSTLLTKNANDSFPRLLVSLR